MQEQDRCAALVEVHRCLSVAHTHQVEMRKAPIQFTAFTAILILNALLQYFHVVSSDVGLAITLAVWPIIAIVLVKYLKNRKRYRAAKHRAKITCEKYGLKVTCNDSNHE